jgi:hypothetical protein
MQKDFNKIKLYCESNIQKRELNQYEIKILKKLIDDYNDKSDKLFKKLLLKKWKSNKWNQEIHFILVGTNIRHVIRLLADNKFKVNKNIRKLKVLLKLLFKLSFKRSLIRLLEKYIYIKKIKKIKIEKDPIFIIGHWRSGTTYLHDFLCQDDRYGYVSTFQTFFPDMCVVADNYKEKIKDILPDKRPMDDVEMHIDNPFEEEFGMSFLYPYSFYHCWAFPEKMRVYFDKYLLYKKQKKIRKKWKKIYNNYLKKIYYLNNQKQLFIKNPLNTARIPLLLELFPEAKFVYIDRNREHVLNSMLNVYIKLNEEFGFQEINENEIKSNTEYFYDNLIARYKNDKKYIKKNNLVEITFENFIKNPVKETKMVYEKLKLLPFEEKKNQFIKYYERKKNYTPKNYTK